MALATGSVQAADKLAFVVGIDDYPNLSSERQLKRAVADATAVGQALGSIGFKTTLVTKDVTQNTFLRRFGEFSRKVTPGDTVFLYFSGHGVAIAGTNYLVPSDIPALTADDERLVRGRSMAEADLISDVRERGARVVVMVIDACRDNPFPRTGTRGIGQSRGLAVNPADGVFAIYSAGAGQEALDSLPGTDPDPNSVFTRVFLKDLTRPGLNLIDLGESVRDDVASLADSVHWLQVPAYYNEVRGARGVFLAGTTDANASSSGVSQNNIPTAPAESPPVRLAVVAPPVRGLDDDVNVKECDRLAASPFDPGGSKNAAGVPFQNLDAISAGRACRAALASFPTSPRIQFELGRALTKDLTASNAAEAAGLYRAAANSNYVAAMNNLAVLYENGRGVANSDTEAVRLYQIAANTGYVVAIHNLANLYHAGLRGLSRDDSEAIRLYRRAADAGYSESMAMLGSMYMDGRGIQRDDTEAFRWATKAADGKSAGGMLLLATLIADGRGTMQDFSSAAGWYRRAADAGAYAGDYQLGYLYETGRGVPKSEAEAVRLYRKAAEGGLTDAKVALGVMLENGRGTARDLNEAVTWYRRGVEGGSIRAMYNLARCEELGIGVRKDEADAARLYRKAADGGYAEAMNELGLMSQKGIGTDMNLAEAVNWYRRASAANSTRGSYNLGLLYQNGLGVPKNDAEALRLFRRSADGGHSGAMSAVGYMIGNGRGSDKNLVEAASWYRRAADAGSWLGADNLGKSYAAGYGVPRNMNESRRWRQRAAELKGAESP